MRGASVKTFSLSVSVLSGVILSMHLKQRRKWWVVGLCVYVTALANFQSSVTGRVSSRKGKVAVLKKIYCRRILHSKKSHP